MSKSRVIFQKIMMVVALYYIVIGIVSKDYFTLSVAVIIYVYELFLMNWNNKKRNNEDHEIRK